MEAGPIPTSVFIIESPICVGSTYMKESPPLVVNTVWIDICVAVVGTKLDRVIVVLDIIATDAICGYATFATDWALFPSILNCKNVEEPPVLNAPTLIVYVYPEGREGDVLERLNRPAVIVPLSII